MADPFSFVIATVAQIGISYLFPSEGPRLKDLKVSASTYGAAIPNTWGDARVAGNMIWSGGIKEKKKKKMAGKGGAVNTYTYSADFAMAFCVGPVDAMRRVWADGKLIYDTTGQSQGVNNGKYRMRVHTGSETQMPDPAIEAKLGVGNVPGYRGLCYIVFEGFQLADFGNRIPQMAAEVLINGVPSQAATDITTISSGALTQISGDVFVDPNRGYIYLQDINNLSGSQVGIRRVRISDGIEDLQVTSSQMGIPVTVSENNGPAQPDNGQFSSIVAVMQDSSLIIRSGGNSNYVPYLRLDPVSLAVTTHWGHSDSIAGSFPSTLGLTTIPGAANGQYLGIYDIWHDVYIIDTYGSAGSITIGGHIANGVQLVSTQDGGPNFWLLVDPPGTAAFQMVECGGQNRVITYTRPPDLSAPVFSLTPQSAVYDASDPGFVVFFSKDGQPFACKLSIDSLSTRWTTKISAIPAHYYSPQSMVVNGEIPFVNTTRLFALDTVSGAFIDRDADPYVDPNEKAANHVDGSVGVLVGGSGMVPEALFYDGLRSTLIVIGTGTAKIIPVGRTTGGATTLSFIVEAMLRRGGLIGKDFDLSALDGVVIRGFGFASATDIKNVLEELRRIYLFDLVETDGKLVAKIRGEGVSQITIPQAILGSSAPEATDFWKETRLQEADLPASITLAYMNIDQSFETSTAVSKRISNPIPTMFSRQQVAQEANLVMTANEAKNQVNKMLYTQWSERTKHNTRLPWRYMILDPTDCITVQMDDGRSYFERLHETEIGADFAIQVETYGQDSGAYVSEVLADGGTGAVTQVVPFPKPAVPFIFNLPLLRDADDTGGSFSRYYTGVGTLAPGDFNGATMFRATTDLDFMEMYAETNDAEWGSVLGAIPPPSHGAWAMDWETEIIIHPAVDWFDLEPCTDDELLAGANQCVIGDEVIQFRDAVENANGTWTIKNLLRARRGTEWAADKHKAGERFTFLSSTTIELQGDLIDARGQERRFKAVGSGRSILDTAPTTIIYEPRDLMPYAPVQITREFTTSDDVDIAWNRRTRLGGSLQSGSGDVALSEVFERYEVYLLNAPFDGDLSRGAAPLAPRRVYVTTSPSVTYSKADQIADGYVANLDTLHVAVYQISAVVGRGFPGVRSIEPWRVT